MANVTDAVTAAIGWQPSRHLRFASRVWALLGLVTLCLGTTAEAYVAMFMIIAAIFGVGDEIIVSISRFPTTPITEGESE